MCGIAGMVQTHPYGGVDSAAVHRMCEAIVHRGPDDEGIFVKAGVGLGMKPPQYLKAGDMVELGIDGLGESRQQVSNFSGE